MVNDINVYLVFVLSSLCQEYLKLSYGLDLLIQITMIIISQSLSFRYLSPYNFITKSIYLVVFESSLICEN